MQWRIVGISLAVALSATCAALFLGMLNSPDGGPTLPVWVVRPLAIVLMPASSALGLLGQHSLSAVPFFGGVRSQHRGVVGCRVPGDGEASCGGLTRGCSGLAPALRFGARR